MIKIRSFVQGPQETNEELDIRVNKDIEKMKKEKFKYKDLRFFVTEYGISIVILYERR